MLKSKKDFYIILFSMIFIFCIAGSSSAALRLPVYDDQVDFELGSQSIFIEGTCANCDFTANTELATIPFTIDFHDGMAPTGNIEVLYVKFEYDPNFLTFVEARPSDGWGTLTEDDYELLHDPINGIIQFTIEPQAIPDFPVVSSSMTLALFDFEAKCQSQQNPNDLTVSLFFDDPAYVSESYVIVNLGPDNSNKYRAEESFVTNGSVDTKFYWVDFRVNDKSYRGAVGSTISVPVNGWSNAMVDGISLSIEYESDKLNYIGIENYETYFPEGFSTDEGYTPPVAGANPIHLDLRTGDAFDANLYPEGEPPGGVEIFNLLFEVVGEWDGQQTIINFVANPTGPNVFVRIGQNGVGYCDELSQSLLTYQSSFHFGEGNISIDAYAAGFESRLLDVSNRIWNTAGDDQTVKMSVKLCNNFDAGPYSWQYNGAITAVVDPPDILTRKVTGFLEQNDDFGATFSYAVDGFSYDTVAIYQYYNTSIPHDDNALPISECDVPEEGGVDLVTLNFDFDDANVTGFMGDEYALDFSPDVSTSNHITKVEASKSQITVLPGDGLDTTAIPFKVATGEFSCDLETSTTYSVDQQYYIRNSFNLASFKVTVAITSGSHYVKTVTPADGVSYTIAPNYKSVTFTSNGDWVPAENDVRAQFAEIHFDNTLPQSAAKALPGDNCYWTYSNSTIAFQDAFMSDLTGDDPLNPTGNQPFLFMSANKIRKATRICPTDPIPEPYRETQAVIPTEYSLYQNYPNPFNPDTKIAFDLPEASHVRIEIFNILGQHVTTLVDETKSAGSYEIYWNATDDNGQKVSSGIYLYIMQAGEYSRSTKMTLMK